MGSVKRNWPEMIGVCFVVACLSGAAVVGKHGWPAWTDGSHQTFAAYLQVLGSLMAIGVAIFIMNRQHELAQRATARERCREVDMMRVCIRSASLQAMVSFQELYRALEEEKPALYPEIQWKMLGAKKVLEQIDLSRLENRKWVSPILSLRRLLEEGCERSIVRRDSPNENPFVLFSKASALKMRNHAEYLFEEIGEMTEIGT